MTDQKSSLTDDALGEVILEFIAIGSSVKVSAVHVATGEEVSVVGPARTTQSELEASAIAKLRYVLEKKTGHDGKPGLII